MGKSLVTPIGRISFPHLDTPNSFGKYACQLLLDKTDPKVKAFVSDLYAAMATEATSLDNKNAQTILAAQSALRDGDDQTKFKTYRAEYVGMFVLSVGRKADFGKPCLVNRNKQPINTNEIYAGCDVLLYIDLYGYNFNGRKGLSVGFQHVMKVNDNEPLTSTGISAESAFGDLDLPDAPAPSAPENPFGNVSVANLTPMDVPPAQNHTLVSQPTPPTPPAPTGSVNPFSGV